MAGIPARRCCRRWGTGYPDVFAYPSTLAGPTAILVPIPDDLQHDHCSHDSNLEHPHSSHDRRPRHFQRHLYDHAHRHSPDSVQFQLNAAIDHEHSRGHRTCM